MVFNGLLGSAGLLQLTFALMHQINYSFQGGVCMPTTNPRVNVVLEEPLYEGLRRWAKRDGVSLSLKVRDLVKEALEAEEDRTLVQLGETRSRTFERSNAMAHSQIWAHLKWPRR
jgi:hypothetical protein